MEHKHKHKIIKVEKTIRDNYRVIHSCECGHLFTLITPDKNYEVE